LVCARKRAVGGSASSPAKAAVSLPLLLQFIYKIPYAFASSKNKSRPLSPNKKTKANRKICLSPFIYNKSFTT
jgi:hypothetical protein